MFRSLRPEVSYCRKCCGHGEDTAVHDSSRCHMPFSTCTVVVVRISLNGVSCSVPSLMWEMSKKKNEGKHCDCDVDGDAAGCWSC